MRFIRELYWFPHCIKDYWGKLSIKEMWECAGTTVALIDLCKEFPSLTIVQLKEGGE